MFLHGHLYRSLATVDDSSWQALLDEHRFWERPGVSLDEEHQDVAFHILMSEGALARDPGSDVKTSAVEFDAVQVPDQAFGSATLVRHVTEWSNMHANNFGAGKTVKMGWYVVRAGGTLGFHIDGPVFLRGARVDLSDASVQRGLIEVQAARRTVLALRFNADDRFMVCSHRIGLRRGDLFEFSNVLPHAYFNKGPGHAVLLVTTYLVEDLIPQEYEYAADGPAAGAAVFSADSPFVLRDSRRHRPVLPTTAESLNFRHEILLPGRVVAGASLLDLGCCIGATGQWALGRGASSYLGVEMQAGFAEVAAELLAGSPNARIACVDSEQFLEESQERFDIVCALGLVHGLFDPIFTLRRAAQRARTYFCFEDFGNHQSMPALVVEPSTPMPVAGEQAGTIGFGWSFSPEALSLVMKFLGFERDCAETFVSGNRWMCRYRRVRDTEEHSASYAKVKRSWI